MKFEELKIPGVFRIQIEQTEDERGSFGRCFCEQEFRKWGLRSRVRQSNVSFNEKAGTLRGMHFQRLPKEEAKLVSCPQGALFDVVLDLRSSSPSFCEWVGVEISEENASMVYVPEGCAHGFQTLRDGTSVFYQLFESYDPALSSGVRYDDPCFGIRWPLPVAVVSSKDLAYPDFVA